MGRAPEPVWAICNQGKSLTPAGIRAPDRPVSSLVTWAVTAFAPFSISASLFSYFFLFKSLTPAGIRAPDRPVSSLVTCAVTALPPFSISASIFSFFFFFIYVYDYRFLLFPLPFLLYFGTLPEIYYQKIIRLPTSTAFKGS